ncbi:MULTISPECIES: hypothetical protein [unclassified Rathayibacter]|uniref:hypothetical protein n=1 Tax=unclassified Rathayibacter TaxID=2609250 RepID=UPI00188D65DA|nr:MULTISPECIES: hypothetical protein [unclassified Rathayibacter]MBF4461801.1 hypothetical protein [Rathayibacter sp. VKM Ac-2879]MBF4503214.1 hypothetical protein [Rathayibacter sp. VKM Ac-2878]
MNLRQQVLVALLLSRQNLNQAVIADLPDISQPAVSQSYRQIVRRADAEPRRPVDRTTPGSDTAKA